METYTSLSGIERKWKYADVERPQGVCYDCRLAYSKFADLSLPRDVWEQINPTYHKGAGLLCPNCICERLGALNIAGVKATIWPAVKPDVCNGCGADFGEFPEMRHTKEECPGPECTCYEAEYGHQMGCPFYSQ